MFLLALELGYKLSRVGWGVVGKAENTATQPSLAGAWAELGKNVIFDTLNILKSKN